MRDPTDHPSTTRRGAVALGYQGFGNVGDEAILSGIEELLSGRSVTVRAVIAGERGPVTAFPHARRITSRRLLPTLAAASELRAARVMLVAGGGLIHDHWPVVIPRYLAWSLLARLCGVRLIWIGVGVGPIRAPWARLAARVTISLAAAVTVRDESSAKWVHRVAPRTRAIVVPDPAFFLPAPEHSGGAGTALIVRRPLPSDERLAPGLLDSLIGLAEVRVRSGASLVIITMEHAEDDAFASKLASGIGQRTGFTPAVVQLALEPRSALEQVARYDEVVSIRFHGLVLCALTDTPCLPIVYDEKVAAVATLLGIDGLAVPIAQVTKERLVRSLSRIRSAKVRKAVRSRLDELRDSGPALGAFIERAANG